jgi:hypothetical protein
MKPIADKEFARDAASVSAALERAEADLERLDWGCVSQASSRILKAMAADAQKLLAKLVAAETGP